MPTAAIRNKWVPEKLIRSLKKLYRRNILRSGFLFSVISAKQKPIIFPPDSSNTNSVEKIFITRTFGPNEVRNLFHECCPCVKQESIWRSECSDPLIFNPGIR